MTGLHLSHYTIEAELGRGGMGIVFRAKDTKLNRTVALKVLPAGALASEDDRARFRREAQAAAQLNHPNVCHVYQVDEAQPLTPDGKPVEGHMEPRLFIAMEYIAGETLHDYVKKGPLKLQEAVNIAGQVAEALKEAHAKDIVHRDIKSANIMLTEGGVAKVLDFGLAKTNQSTMLTRMGSTLGTVAYMSPEQARGQEVDGRSDLYSLGTMLYEMVAGRLPYTGDYEQAVLYGILNEAPEPLTAVRTGVPMQLEWVVEKLLKKEAEYRYQSAAGLLADLKSLDLSGSGLSRRSMPAVSAAGRRPAVPHWAWAAMAGALVLGFALAWLLRPLPEAEQPVRRLVASFAPSLDFGNRLAVSADGRAMATISLESDGWATVVRFFDEPDARVLAATGSTAQPALSPDARWVAYHRGDNLMRVSTSGGAPEVLATINGSFVTYLNQDELVTNAANGTELHLVEVTGGVRGIPVVTDRDLQLYGLAPVHGSRLVLAAAWDGERTSVVAVHVDTGEVRAIAERASWPKYHPSGYVLFFRNGDLHAIRFDPDSGTRGSSFVVQTRVGSSANDNFVLADVSASDLLVYSVGDQYAGDELGDRTISVIEDGKERSLDLDQNQWWDPRFSPDGRRLLAHGLSVDGGADIWLVDLVRSTLRRMTVGPLEDETAVWAPDGRFFYFAGEDQSVEYLIRQSVDGSAPNDTIHASTSHMHVESVSGDDNHVVLMLRTPSTGEDLWLVERETREARPLLATGADEAAGKISPSGRILAYQSSESGRPEVYVAQFPAMVGIQAVSVGGGETPVWSRDGRWLYFVAQDVLWRVDFSEGEPGGMERVMEFDGSVFLASPHTAFDVYGDRIAFVRAQSAEYGSTDVQLVTGLGTLLRSLDPALAGSTP